MRLPSVPSRRELLRRAGAGLRRAGPGRPARRGGAGRGADVHGRSAPVLTPRPRSPAAAALPGAGQARDLPVHARRAVPGRHVRLQAAARSATTASRCRSPSRGSVSAETGNLLASPWKFRQHGESGIVGQRAVSRTSPGASTTSASSTRMHGTNSRHGGALLELHTGSDTFVRPSMGSWITYGLGTENQNLPGFITICPTLAHGGVNNCGSAFLPAVYQGTPIGNAGVPVRAGPDPVHRERRRRPRDLQRLRARPARRR